MPTEAAFTLYKTAGYKGEQLKYEYDGGKIVNKSSTWKPGAFKVAAGYVVSLYLEEDGKGSQPTEVGHTPTDSAVSDTIVASNAKGNKIYQDFKSFRIRKLCDHESWTWDASCDAPNPTANFGDCQAGTKCFEARQKTCATGDSIATQQQCKTFCGADLDRNCPSAMLNFCTKNPEDALCKGKDMIDAVAKGACAAAGAADWDKLECQTYCAEAKNAGRCATAIRDFCTLVRLESEASDGAFCRGAMGREALWGRHNEVVQKYCDGKGRGTPLCTCMDVDAVDKAFAKLPAEARKALAKSPECTHRPCTSNPAAYRASAFPKSCPVISVCLDDLDGTSLPDGVLGTVVQADLGCEDKDGGDGDGAGGFAMAFMLAEAGKKKEREGLSGGAIAGIVVGAVLCCLCLAAAVGVALFLAARK